jgi:ADP-heptose:LPS heptosyltransferase
MTRKLRTDTFREAMGVLRGAALFVGTDGGLHHAAAALGIPAVVIWTGFTSPKHLGYASHTNLYAGGDPCGTLHKACQHCRKNAESISPEQVLTEVEKIYEERIRNLAS